METEGDGAGPDGETPGSGRGGLFDNGLGSLMFRGSGLVGKGCGGLSRLGGGITFRSACFGVFCGGGAGSGRLGGGRGGKSGDFSSMTFILSKN